MWSEAQQERLDLQRARVLECNRHLNALVESWERGGFPIHMNLALHHHSSGAPYQYPNNNNNAVNSLKQELNQKNEKLTILEREKAALILSLQRSRAQSQDDGKY
jgi:hypothetical protein